MDEDYSRRGLHTSFPLVLHQGVRLVQCRCKTRNKKIQLLPVFVLALSPFAAVSKMKIQRLTIESSYIFRPISPNFTQVKGCSRKHAQSCSCTCKLLHTYAHELGKGIKPCFFQSQKPDLCLSLRISVREEW